MLHRIIFGNFCTILAFIAAALLEIQVNQKEISMLWQLPQFFILAIAEIFVYLSHLNFTYKEAPASMKPVMIAFMYLSIALGDFIVAIISGVSLFDSQVIEYFFFAFLMLLDVALLIFLANRYKYTDHEMIKSLEEEE
jgi:dipeptide/tripeptide permease